MKYVASTPDRPSLALRSTLTSTLFQNETAEAVVNGAVLSILTAGLDVALVAFPALSSETTSVVPSGSRLNTRRPPPPGAETWMK